MSTNLKEWLHQTIAELEEERDATPGAVNEDAAMALAAMKLALASLEAKPIGAFHISDQQVGGTTDYIKDGEWPIDDGVIEVYAAPPAPVSVTDIKWPEEKFCPAEYAGSQLWEETEIWNKAIDACKAACRAAMLQGADGNSPVIQDGWVACSERMPGPSTGVIVAAPWQSAPDGYAMKWATNCPGHPDADTDGWIIPGASWSPTHWMPLPASPQQRG
ncbi:DUF551 domain-containing protein [Enterobacter intestinihominis]